MFKIADRYIIKKFLSTLFFILLMFSLLTVVFDASEKLDKYIRQSVTFNQIVFGYYMNFLPFILNLISPIFIFISALYFTSRMAYRSEIVAFYASGVSFWRLLQPYITVAVFLAIVDFFLKGWIVPVSNRAMVDFENTYLAGNVIVSNRNLHRQLEEGVFFYVESYSYSDSLGRKFAYEVFDKNVLVRKLRAQTVRWNAERKQWYALNFVDRTITNGVEKLNVGDTLYVNLKLKPTDFNQSEKSIFSMTNTDLSEHIRIETLSGNPDVKYYKVELYQRYSLPFASFILIVIAFSLSSRKVRGGIGMHLMLGLLIAVSYILIGKFTTTFAQYSTLDPVWAVWLPNILFTFLSIYLLIRSPK